MAEQIGYYVGDRFVDAWGRDIDPPGTEESYADMPVKKLQAIAQEREIDLTGVKKKSELIELLEAADAAEADGDGNSD